MSRFERISFFFGLCLAIFTANAGATCGPVVMIGHDADEHGFVSVYAGLFDDMRSNVTNGGTGILVIGADVPGTASTWIANVASSMAVPETLTYINDALIATTSFDGFAIIFIPSDFDDTPGGISAPENALLTTRRDDVTDFVNWGGGLFGLTQGLLPDAYDYLGGVGGITSLSIGTGCCGPSGVNFADVTATPAGLVLGITDTNVDGCCFHAVFKTYPPFLEVLAFANAPDPGDEDYHEEAVYLGGPKACLLWLCGDGTLDSGEGCDDGNDEYGDGCRPNCTIEICGDGILDPGEACDDGNGTGGDGCRPDCTVEICGDGIVDAGEDCDDGNTIPGDGCRADCTPEICGDGILDPGEDCDDGNTIPGDGCRADCTPEICGDGILDPSEDCDDGNRLPGDGCDVDCMIELSVSWADFGAKRTADGVQLHWVTSSESSTAGFKVYSRQPSGVIEVLSELVYARGGGSLYTFTYSLHAAETDEPPAYRVVEITVDGEAGDATPWFEIESASTSGRRSRARRRRATGGAR